MFTCALRILQDEDLARDAVQETFIDVFRDIAGYRQQARLASWMKTIVVRKALHRLQLEKKHFSGENPDEKDSIEWPTHISADDLDKAINTLAPGYRAVFTLVEIEGYSHKEVAGMLGFSESNSKTQLFHAKKMLRHKLKAYKY